MKNVLLLCGGNSTEHKVSLMSAQSILENIDKTKFNISACIIDFDNCWYEYHDTTESITEWKNYNIKKVTNIIEYLQSFDIVFPITHGINGEDGKLQGMLDLFNIKYVGCKTLSSAIGMDKVFSKIVFKYLNIPQVPFIIVKNPKCNIKDITDTLDFPMIIKPANGGSSIGISKVNNKVELKKAIKQAFKFDKKIIVEKFIIARELECAIMKDKICCTSEVGEIKSANDFYDYNAKYENKKSYTLIPADISKSVSDQIKEYAKIAFNGLEGCGFARVDFFYDETNEQIYINEINTLPGFTSISMYPQLFIQKGISYKDLITKLLNNC